MKSVLMMSTALLLLRVHGMNSKNNVSPEQSFALIKNISKVVVQPQETLRLIPEEYFRGQQLTYEWEVKFVNGTKVRENIVEGETLVTMTEPIRQLSSVDLASGNSDEQSLPQTSLIYVGQNKNRFLILIDYQMNLQIHDITSYYMDTTQEKRDRWRRDDFPIVVDLYKDNEYISEDRDCNNLVQLDESNLMVICKSNFPTKSQHISVSVFINIEKLDERSIKRGLRYFISGLSYEILKDGAIIVMEKLDQNYTILVKQNTSNCHFNLFEMDPNGRFDERVVIYDFKDPNIIDEEVSITKPVVAQGHKTKRKRTSIQPLQQSQSVQQEKAADILNRKTPLEQLYTGCGIEVPIEFDTKHITYLTIKDIKVMHHLSNVIVATDFNYGVLFWQIMKQSETGKRNEWTAKPLYRLRQEKVSAISYLPLEDEKVIFVSQVSPLKIIEIDVSSLEKPPFAVRNYKLGGVDNDQFYHLDVMDANNNYILIQAANVRGLRTMIRIYKRATELYSSIYAELNLDDFMDTGLFLKFINPGQNFFLLKTSNNFKIFKMQERYLEIDVWNLTMAAFTGQKNTAQEQVLLKFTLTARNQTKHSLTTTFDLLVTDENNVHTQAMVASDQAQAISFKYICGERELEGSGVVDDYFSGKKNRLVLWEQDSDKLFYLTNIQMTFQRTHKIPVKDCHVSTLIPLQLPRRAEYIACAGLNGRRVSLYEITHNPNIKQENEQSNSIPSFDLPESNVLNFHYDASKNNLFIISNTSAYSNQTTAVLHIYRLYNIFNWELTIDLQKQIPKLKDFKLRSYDQITFFSSIQQGTLLSEKVVTGRTIFDKVVKQKIVVFELLESSNSEKERLQIRGIIEYTIPQIDVFGKNDLDIRQTRIDDQGFIWVLLSNGTVVVHQQVGPLNSDDPEDNNRYMNLQMIREYQRLEPGQKINRFKRDDNSVININVWNEMVVVFSGENMTTLREFDHASLELEKSMILPLYISKDEEFDLSKRLSFVIKTQTQKVTYAQHQDIMIVLYQVFLNQRPERYRLYVYNILEPRHNSLIMRTDVVVENNQLVDTIDPTYVRIQMFTKSNDVIGVILTLDGSNRAIYEFHHRTQVKLNFSNIETLNELCKKSKDGPDYHLSVYPSDNPKEFINITINTENKGLIITKDHDKEYLTLQVEEQSEYDKNPGLKTAKYALLSNFHGQNMNFSFTCFNLIENNTSLSLRQQERYNTQEICDDLSGSQRVLEKPFSIEFLSSKNPALGFFIIEPFILFLDQTMARVYFLNLQQYENIELLQLFPFMAKQMNNNINKLKQQQRMDLVLKPPQFQMFHLVEIYYNDTKPRQQYRYLFSKNSYNQVSLQKVFAVFSDNDLAKANALYQTGNFLRFNKSDETNRFLLIQKAEVYATVYADVSLIEFYAINPSEKNYLGAIIVYDRPESPYIESRIEQYIFDLRDENSDCSNVSIGRNFTFKSLYSERLGLNQFKVSAVKFLEESRILVIGLKNIGLMIFSIDSFKILKIELLQNRISSLGSLMIRAIIPQTDQHFKLLTKDHGVLIITYQEELQKRRSTNPFKTYNPYLVDPYIYETQGVHEGRSQQPDQKDINKMLYAVGKYGIAYTELSYSETLDSNKGGELMQYLRFFSFPVSNNSKPIGSYKLAYPDEACTNLQIIDQSNFLDKYLPGLNQDSMVVAVLCDTTLKVIAFNYHPSIEIKLQDSYNMEVSESIIEIKADNNVTTETFNLHITLLNQEKAMSSWFYFCFLVVIGGSILIFQLIAKKSSTALEQDENNAPPGTAKKTSTQKKREQSMINQLQEGQTASKEMNVQHDEFVTVPLDQRSINQKTKQHLSLEEQILRRQSQHEDEKQNNNYKSIRNLHTSGFRNDDLTDEKRISLGVVYEESEPRDDTAVDSFISTNNDRSSHAIN